MRQNWFIYIVVIAGMAACNSSQNRDEGFSSDGDEAPREKQQTDKAYAADEYGMKQYVLAFLKRGPNRDQDSLTAAKIQRAHLDNITRLSDSGLLVLAGPFLDDGDIRGIYIFNVETVQEAERLTATDPAIQSGRLTMELHPWYGTVALQEIYELHKKIAKKSI